MGLIRASDCRIGFISIFLRLRTPISTKQKKHLHRKILFGTLLACSNNQREEKMETLTKNHVAAEVANLTFQLLTNCNEKEERLAAQFEITVPEFRTLRIFRGELQLPIKELIKRIHLSGSRLTRILTELEKKGFLVRSIDPEDRRGINVTLTKKGRSMSEALEHRYIQIHEEILADVPVDRQEEIMGSLSNLLRSLETWLRNS